MELPKYYLFTDKNEAKNLVDLLSLKYGEKTQYTEIRESNNGKGYAVRADEFTATVTIKKTEYLPIDFYLEQL